MDFKNDINEIIALVNVSIKDFGAKDPGYCISEITKPLDDDYLTNRGNYFSDSFKSNKSFNKAIEKLSTICNENQRDCINCPIQKYCNAYISHAQENIDYNAPKIIDLFCGAGGLSLGFTQEGFITALANDIEPCCVDTYSHNHPETPRKHIVLGDINNVIANIKELMRFEKNVALSRYVC